MRWHRWKHWTRDDPRWDVVRLDTSVAPVEDTVEEVARWIVERRSAYTGALRALVVLGHAMFACARGCASLALHRGATTS